MIAEQIATAQAELLNDATKAAAGEFERRGIRVTSEELDRINDLLSDILRGRVPRWNSR